MKKRKIRRPWKVVVLTAQMLWHICFLSYGAMGEPVSNRLENDRQILSEAGQCLREGKREGEFYVTGRNYMPEGTVLESFYGDSLEYSNTLEEMEDTGGATHYKMRFAVKWKLDKEEEQDHPKEEGEEKQYWSLGDTVIREIGGQRYCFRCIDQNYKTRSTSGQTAALFLCDAVIPADWGSSYEYGKQDDGSYGYTFRPGPIVHFGDSNDYKYSKIRQWLKSQEEGVGGALWVHIGVEQSYTGQTETGGYSQLQEKNLHSYHIGSQQMTDRLFILSVEEALRYKEYLWNFGGMPESGRKENPESQTGAFSKGYWLRSPEGEGDASLGSKVYIVDLTDGTIRPEKSRPNEETDDSEEEHLLSRQKEEWMITSSIGVRPALALPQQG